MKTIVKQVLGVDVAQKELVVCLGYRYADLDIELTASGQFPNTPKGFHSLITWVKRISKAEVSIDFVMEATGVYHEKFAVFLVDKGYKVCIVLPNKISSYFRTLDVKTITDKTSSQTIATFGLERKLDSWVKPQAIYKNLRQLTRERDQLIQERTMIKNQLHAERAEADPNVSSIRRAEKRLELLKRQEKEVIRQIAELIAYDEKLKSDTDRICSIPGIGLITAATILGETNGFNLIRNKKQLTSYAGLDIREKQSGTSVKGKPSISKRGNKHLRKAMHLPALAAIRHNPRYKGIFARLVSKHGIKMKAAVAVQRKLLELAYIVFKNKSIYDSQKNEGQLLETSCHPSQAGSTAA